MRPRVLLPVSWARWGPMVESVAANHGVTVDEVLGRCRVSEVAAARHDLMACLYGSGLSLSAIGRLLGRDHTTVLAAVRKELAA